MIELTPDELNAAMISSRLDLHTYNRLMFRFMRRVQWKDAPHHRIICQALMDVFYGRRRNLLINIPPRYSKTELAVMAFCSWAMGRVPDAEFIHCSSTALLANSNSAKVMNIVNHPVYKRVFPRTKLKRGSREKKHWSTTAGGVFYSAGADGQITGFGAGKKREGFGGAIVFDDMHKASEARSDIKRNKVIEFFTETLMSRRNDPSRTPIIGIGQRLHENDIAGFLIDGGCGEPFDLICLPAITETGEALWPAMHSIEDLRRMQVALPYMFAGQYMQAPAPAEGNIFKPGNLRVVEAVPLGVRWVRGWDLASLEGDGDFTAGGKVGISPDGHIVIQHVEHFQGGPDEVEKTIKTTAQLDGKECTIKLPQDPGQAGKAQSLAFARLLAEFTIRCEPVTGDKITRASPLAAQVNMGNVLMLKGDWNRAVMDEMRMFPNGKHDDIVDALADAYNALYTGDTGLIDYYASITQRSPAKISGSPGDVIVTTHTGWT